MMAEPSRPDTVPRCRAGSRTRNPIAVNVRAMSWRLVLIGLAGALLAACGSSGPPTPISPSPNFTTAPSTPARSASLASPGSPVFGRWEQRHSCEQLVVALKAHGLENVAPAIVGDFFPKNTPQQLAKKGSHICNGAAPQSHGHFFTNTGSFGSLDQNGKQVDNGKYEVVDNHTIQVNLGRFEYRVANGALVLKPIISATDRKAALAAPHDFSTAGWQVAVTYDGLPWHTVPCQGWC